MALYHPIKKDGDLLSFTKSHDDNTLKFVFNFSAQPHDTDMKDGMDQIVSSATDVKKLDNKLTLPPYGWTVLK